jgi:membrane associated rhomboid family serine protease
MTSPRKSDRKRSSRNHVPHSNESARTDARVIGPSDTYNHDFHSDMNDFHMRHWETEEEVDTVHSSSDNNPNSGSNNQGSNSHKLRHEYSITHLVQTLSSGDVALTSLSPELQRRVRDFRLAQDKRRIKYGEPTRWGIFGMYAHLESVRTDLEWAEDAAWRRDANQPYLSWNDFELARQQQAHKPWFTYVFIIICTLMLLVELGINGWHVESLKVNPMIGPSAQSLIRAGARETTLMVDQGQWFRIFSPVILHAGLIHYCINMLAMWFIGAAVEQSHGVVNTMLLFFIPGFGGNILSAIFLPQYISVGASGGIFGLVGACLADLILNWQILFVRRVDEPDWRRQAVGWLVFDILINMILGLTPYIDNFTHLGGFLYGLCIGLSTLEVLPVGFFGVQTTSLLDKIRTLFVRYFGLLLSFVLMLTSTIYLATSQVGDNPCPNCRYISCVPFPFHKPWWSCDDCSFVMADLFKKNVNDTYYDRIELTCPDQTLESISIASDQWTTREQVQKRLPSYCREHCDSVFRNHH